LTLTKVRSFFLRARSCMSKWNQFMEISTRESFTSSVFAQVRSS
jgi:hypothetical protein